MITDTQPDYPSNLYPSLSPLTSVGEMTGENPSHVRNPSGSRQRRGSMSESEEIQSKFELFLFTF